MYTDRATSPSLCGPSHTEKIFQLRVAFCIFVLYTSYAPRPHNKANRCDRSRSVLSWLLLEIPRIPKSNSKASVAGTKLQFQMTGNARRPASENRNSRGSRQVGTNYFCFADVRGVVEARMTSKHRLSLLSADDLPHFRRARQYSMRPCASS